MGEWAHGKRHGYGVFYYANGSKYEGQWVSGYKEGEGTMTFDNGSVYRGPFKNDHMVNRLASGHVDVASPKQAPSQQKGKGLKGPEAKAFTSQRARREVEANPFKSLIDISDLTEFEEDELKSEKEVLNILLSHYSAMKLWYGLYTHSQEEREETFTMVSKQFWRLLRDCKVLSYKVPIAHANRLFLQGSKNRFTIQGPPEERVNLGQSYSKTSTQHFSPHLDLSGISEHEVPEEPPSEGENEQLIELDLDDVHSATRPLLLRQFIEGLVRVAFLKFANGGKLSLDNERLGGVEGDVYIEKPKTQLGIAVYNLFAVHLLPNVTAQNASPSEEALQLENNVQFLNSAAIEELFVKYAKNDRGFINNRKDLTIEVGGLLCLLQNARIVPKLLSQESLFSIIEKHHDPQTAYSRIRLSALSDHLKTKTLIKLLGSELTEHEFKEVLVHVAAALLPTEDSENSSQLRLEQFVNSILLEGLQSVAESPSVASEGSLADPPPEDKKPELPKKTEKVEPPQLPTYEFEYVNCAVRAVKSKKDLLIEKREQEKQLQLDREAREAQEMNEQDFNVKTEN